MSDGKLKVTGIHGTNEQGGSDRIILEGTSVREGTPWLGQSLCNDLGGIRVMDLMSDHDPKELESLISAATSHLSSRGWRDLMFDTSDGTSTGRAMFW